MKTERSTNTCVIKKEYYTNLERKNENIIMFSNLTLCLPVKLWWNNFASITDFFRCILKLVLLFTATPPMVERYKLYSYLDSYTSSIATWIVILATWIVILATCVLGEWNTGTNIQCMKLASVLSIILL